MSTRRILINLSLLHLSLLNLSLLNLSSLTFWQNRHARPGYLNLPAIAGAFILLAAFAHPTFANADQSDPQLDELFDSLKLAQSNSESKEIENQIWRIWLEAPDEYSADLLSQVTYAMSVGQHELALRISNELVDSAPEYAEGWNKRATLQYILGNHGLSVADIKETLILEPRHFGALSGLGLIFMRSGNLEAAHDVFSRVVEITPGSENARGSLERVESMLGEKI